MSKIRTDFSRRAFLISQLLLAHFFIISCAVPVGAQTSRAEATIRINARKVENHISPLLYGQFLEYMFEGIKYGLHAELLRDRGFENSLNAIGLPRYWECYPDDRVDDYAPTRHR